MVTSRALGELGGQLRLTGHSWPRTGLMNVLEYRKKQKKEQESVSGIEIGKGEVGGGWDLRRS